MAKRNQVGFVFGKIWLFLLLTWHFMSSGTSVKFNARNHTVVNLLGLGTMLHASLANRMGASVEVAKARCHYCFAKPGLLFSPFEPRSVQ